MSNAESSARLSPADWWQGAAARRVLSALDGQARFVGGAVRDGLLGRPVNDVDLATPLLPSEVVRRAEAAGIKAVPTGIEHGTVTLVADHHPFEVTTLRRDVSTDGRRATVAFSTDWAEDARRRDFTVNALFADAEGRISDYTDGLADLSPTRIRFIGRAEDRIREDYLRLLRFFRFHAHYAATPLDGAGMAAAAALAPGLATLSAERVWAELKKLLSAPDPAAVLAAMRGAGILAVVLPEAVEPPVLPPGGWGERLLSLLPEGVALEQLSGRLRWSRDELRRMRGLQAAAEGEFSHPFGLLRAHGAGVVAGGLAVRRARGYEDADRWAAEVAGWQPVSFPLTGRDLIALGAAPGPDLGRRLTALEAAWEAEGCRLDRAGLLARVVDES